MVLKIITERALRRTVAWAAAAVILCLLTAGAGAQDKRNQKPNPIDVEKGNADEPERSYTTLEEEMRAKREIRAAEKEYQENLERARDLSVIGASIVTSFNAKNALDREDIKKLEKVEKLAKGIRSAAGGSEDEVEMEKPPKDLRAAVDMLGDLSKSLKERVEKTPKHVISAAVIDEANVLLQLIRIVRTLPSKA